MKKKIIILLVIVVLLVGIGVGGTFAYNYYKSPSSKELFDRFLGIEEGNMEAVCDVDFAVLDHYGDRVFGYNKGDCFEIRDIESKILKSNSSYAKKLDLYYAYLYEDTENPVLAILVEGGPGNIYHNSSLMFFTVVDEEIHLSSVQNPIGGQFYAEVHLTEDGAIWIKDYVVGEEHSYDYQYGVYFVNQDASIEEGFTWASLSGNMSEWMAYDKVVCPIFTQYYVNSDRVTLNMIEMGDETYFYLDGSENKEFVEKCKQKGKDVINDKDELYGIIDDHFQSIGFDVKMDDIEDNDIDWEKIK